MKIKFIKKYVAFHDFEGAFGTSTIYEVGTTKNVSTNPAQWLIDNGFAEEVKEGKWWKPKYNEEYFYIGHDGSVHPCLWANDPLDNGRLKFGSVFKTEEAAIRCRDYWEAIATVRQDEGVLTLEQIREKESWHCDVYYIWKTFAGDCRVMTLDMTAMHACPNAIFFYKVPDAEASLEKHSDEWNTILDYDWSRE